MWESVTRGSSPPQPQQPPSSAFHPLGSAGPSLPTYFTSSALPPTPLANPELSKGTTVVFLDIQQNTSNTLCGIFRDEKNIDLQVYFG